MALGEQPGRGHPRSGAKLRPAAIAWKADVILPTGAFIQAFPGDRANFALTFRMLFSDQEIRDFLAGTNDRAADRLFGEHLGTFPTVTEQLPAIREDQKTDGPVRASAAISSSPTYQFVRQTFLQPRRAMVPDARVPGGR